MRGKGKEERESGKEKDEGEKGREKERKKGR